MDLQLPKPDDEQTIFGVTDKRFMELGKMVLTKAREIAEANDGTMKYADAIYEVSAQCKNVGEIYCLGLLCSSLNKLQSLEFITKTAQA